MEHTNTLIAVSAGSLLTTAIVGPHIASNDATGLLFLGTLALLSILPIGLAAITLRRR